MIFSLSCYYKYLGLIIKIGWGGLLVIVLMGICLSLGVKMNEVYL